MQRRELFVILGASFVPDALLAQIPAFFSSEELTIIESLAEIILPSDAQSAGAREAGVAAALDRVLAKSSATEQSVWRTGLQQFDRTAQAAFGARLSQCTPAELHSMVETMAAREFEPKNAADTFFGILKWKIVDVYCATDIGLNQYLGYRGDTAISGFPGCTHAEHQT